MAKYKVEKETEHLEELHQQVYDAEMELFSSKMAYSILYGKLNKEFNEKREEIVEKKVSGTRIYR